MRRGPLHTVRPNMKSLMAMVDSWPVVHRMVAALRIRERAGRWLARHPRRKRLPGSGIEYRVTDLESLYLSDEIFGREIYRAAFDGATVNTFIDVGANVGFFFCYAAHRAGRRDVTALAVEANPALLPKLETHRDINGLAQLRIVWGAAGAPSGPGSTVELHCAESHLGSSLLEREDPHRPGRSRGQNVSVTAVSVGALWIEHAGDKPVDLLKLDIEGAEAAFIDQERELLQRTQRLVIEWHTWLVDRDAGERKLAECGLRRRALLEEGPGVLVELYAR